MDGSIQPPRFKEKCNISILHTRNLQSSFHSSLLVSREQWTHQTSQFLWILFVIKLQYSNSILQIINEQPRTTHSTAYVLSINASRPWVTACGACICSHLFISANWTTSDNYRRYYIHVDIFWFNQSRLKPQVIPQSIRYENYNPFTNAERNLDSKFFLLPFRRCWRIQFDFIRNASFHIQSTKFLSEQFYSWEFDRMLNSEQLQLERMISVVRFLMFR